MIINKAEQTLIKKTKEILNIHIYYIDLFVKLSFKLLYERPDSGAEQLYKLRTGDSNTFHLL